MLKRVLSFLLIVVLLMNGDLLVAGAEAPAEVPSEVSEEMPSEAPEETSVIIEEGEGYVIEELPSGLKKMTLTLDREEKDPQEQEQWTDQGESWENAGKSVKTHLRKTYEKNQPLVTLRRNGTSISFAPIQIEEAASEPVTEVMEGQQLNERQTASNVLRIGPSKKGRPERIRGRLRSGSGAKAAPAVYEELFDEHTDVHWTALRGGVKEDIVIHGYTGNHVYAYQVAVSGMELRQQGQRVDLVQEGQVIGEIAAPFMVDANGVYSEAIAVTLEASGNGNWLLTYAPDDAWMAAEERAYPVTVDPVVMYGISLGNIQGTYVDSSFRDRNYGDTGQLRVGTFDVGASTYTYISFVQCVIPTPLRSGVLIDNVHMNIHSSNNNPGTFTVSRVRDSWGAGVVTWNTQPRTGGPSVSFTVNADQTYNYVDVTPIFVRWLNTLNQAANHGIAITKSSTANNFKTFYSSRGAPPLSFEVYYWDPMPVVTNLTATGYGYGEDSEEGWVELSWNRISGVTGYYVGIFTGKKDNEGNALYEYIYVGNVNSFSTEGKGLWPTPDEVEAGKFDLHRNGGGAELHAWPLLVYQNAGNDAYAGDLNYYFRVVPSNSYQQLPADANAATVNVILPIDMPPSRPSRVISTPPSWTNADTVRIDWVGTMYYDVDEELLTNDLAEGGWMEYTADPEDIQDEAGMDWIPTGSTLGTDYIELSTMHDALAGPLPRPSAGAAPWEDGIHLVLVRGIGKNGKTGRARGVQVFTDKTPPTAPEFSATPKSWSNADTAGFTWSGISDLTDLARVEWSADGGRTWYDTGRTDKTYVGHVQDTTMLADGEYNIWLRGVDLAGNLGHVDADNIFIDRNGPTVDAAGFTPGAYSAANRINFYWRGLKDLQSGIDTVGYAWGQDELIPIDITRVNGQIPFDVSKWDDGPYFLTFERVDNIGNIASDVLQFYRDTVPPTAALLSPLHGDTIGGLTEVWALIEDDTLDRWTLTAIRQNGQRVMLAQGTEPQGDDMLLMLDALQFNDGERVRLELYAVDKAGNSTTDRATVTVAQITPLPVSVNILAPAKGAVITEAAITGSYEIAYPGTERLGVVYLDGGAEMPPHTNRSFPIEAIRYAEGSSHTVAVISEDTNGDIHYSEGLGARLLLSEALERTGPGEVESQEIRLNRPMLGLRLHTSQELNGGAITYEYTTDGAVWSPITPGRDVHFGAPQTQVKVRAQLSGNALLKTWDIEGVVEFNPVRFTVRLMGEVIGFPLEGGIVRQALAPVAPGLDSSIGNRQLFENGERHDRTLVYDALTRTDGARVTLSGLAMGDGQVYGSGAARSVLLLRQTREATGTVTAQAASAQDLYALRLVPFTKGGGGQYSYSVDEGSSWSTIRPGEYAWLDSPVKHVILRAQMNSGATLIAWHLEGVTAEGTRATVQLVEAPLHVVAADYSEYYQNPELRMHQLTWADPTPEDTTQPNTTVYEIERDGELLATVERPGYIDEEFTPGARYRVRTIRTYAPPSKGNSPRYLTRESDWVNATPTQLKPVQRIMGVQPSIGEMNESEYLDWLYGGSYTLSNEPNPPTGGRALDQKLLGTQKLCALGFEPINFNTGNFYLMMQDVYVPDAGGTALDVIRTYNTQSEELNGPFGSRWNTDYAQHLVLYGDGSLGWRRGDGGLNTFTLQPDGSYVGNDDDSLEMRICEEQNEYQLVEKDGTIRAFTGAGLLKRIQQANGQAIQIERDGRGLITGVIAPSGARLEVEMDELGHIIAITTPGGAVTRYAYEGNDLARVTDANGNHTRYLYDELGRMTEWFDASGARQVYNVYDERNRVVYQEDARDGKYYLEYFDDHTVTTDAEGNVNEIWFDEQKRTVRQVDGEGAATATTYDAHSNITSETDGRGRTITYANDERGNRLSATTPDGATVRFAYDEANNLIRQTDALGNVTAYEYDEFRNLLNQTNADGSVFHYTYDELGHLITVTDALGVATHYAYNERGWVIQETDALGHVTTHAYDADGRRVSTTDALGSVTTFECDAKGNMTALTFADGTQLHYTYDPMGRPITMADPLGNVTKYKYDALGNVTEITLPDGTKQSAKYNLNNQLTEATDALGATASYTYDGNGSKLTETDALGAVTAYEYDAAGWPTVMTLPTGATETYTYDPQTGLLVSSADVTGLTNAFAYDAAGNLLERTLPGGATLRNEYDEMNRLVRQTNPLGGVTGIAYDLMGNITSVTDPLGAVTRFEYDAAGRLVKTIDALGNETLTAYDALGRIASVTDALGASTSYDYDAVGDLVSVTDALGAVSSFDYDGAGNLVGITDPLGHSAELAYNALGQATRLTQKNGGIIASEYDKAGRLIKETDPLGSTTAYAYDPLGRVTQVTDALRQKALFEYDALGNITKITAPGGGQTLYAYDAGGRLLSNTDELGLETHYAYNEQGQITQVEVNGNATELAYDAMGNITSVTDAEGRQVTFEYDLNGNQVRTVYPDGSADETAYDLLGRVTETRSPGKPPTAYTYDPAGRMTAVTQGERTVAYEYDALGRLIKQTLPDDAENHYAYDALGNLIGETDPLGAVTQYAYGPEAWLEKILYANGASQELAYDLAGRVTSATDAEGATTRYAYDKVGRLTKVTDALGNATGYGYNALDQLVQVKDAMGRLTRYEYDARGNLLSERDALGNKTAYEYTPEGWLERIIKPNGAVIAYEYDKTGQLLAQNAGEDEKISHEYNAIGKLTVTETAEGKTEYQYNENGYLVSVKHPGGETLKYTYDDYGRKDSLTYPDGKTVHYAYDEMDRLVKVTGLEGEVTSYAYDARGQRVKTESDGLITDYAYDVMGNLTEQKTSGKSALELAYTYTPGGRIASETRIENSETILSQYTYDPLGQLTHFTKSDGYGEKYKYDAVGNMKQRALTEGNRTTYINMTHNKNNQMTSMSSNVGRIDYKYDTNGNLTSKQMGRMKDTYTYDAMDRLIGYKGYDGFEQQYMLDSYGLRTGMQQKGDTNRLTLEEKLQGKKLEEDAAAPDVDEWVKTSYIYDVTLPYGQLLTETSGASTTAYTYGLERISALNGSLKTQYVYDGRGSVAQTVANGNMQSYVYTPFGEQFGAKQTGFGFNAEWYDAATGMQNLRARQYEPGMMRFSQKDILRGGMLEPLSLNRYAYVVNDPINRIDPSGMIYSNTGPQAGIIAQQINARAAQLAKSAAQASGQKQQELLDEWYKYCTQNYQYLSGTVLAEYKKARDGVLKGGNRYEELLKACRDLVKGIELRDENELITLKNELAVSENLFHSFLGYLDDFELRDQINQKVIQALNNLHQMGLSEAELLKRTKSIYNAANRELEAKIGIDNTYVIPFAIGLALGVGVAWILPIFAPGFFAKAATVGTAAAPVASEIANKTGQIHHVLSNKIMSALNSHPTLKGVFQREMAQFKIQAMDAASHLGYQTWHRAYDAHFVQWLADRPLATPQQFLAELTRFFNTADMIQRFGSGVSFK